MTRWVPTKREEKYGVGEDAPAPLPPVALRGTPRPRPPRPCPAPRSAPAGMERGAPPESPPVPASPARLLPAPGKLRSSLGAPCPAGRSCLSPSAPLRSRRSPSAARSGEAPSCAQVGLFLPVLAAGCAPRPAALGAQPVPRVCPSGLCDAHTDQGFLGSISYRAPSVRPSRTEGDCSQLVAHASPLGLNRPNPTEVWAGRARNEFVK